MPTETLPPPDVDREAADAQRLRDLQTAVARQRRIDKSARRDPATQELVDDHAALVVLVAELREKYLLLESAHTVAAAAGLNLNAALDNARAEAAKLRVELAKLRDKKD